MANPNDPIAQTLAAEARAREAYDTAGYHRNFLEQKAKKGDSAARAELPKAQKAVESAQEDLKRIQTQLAALTGTDDPHAKQKVAKATPEDLKNYYTKKKGNEKKEKPENPAPANTEKLVVAEMQLPVRGEMMRSSFIVERKMMKASLIEFLDSKELKKNLEKYRKNMEELKRDLKTPPSGEMIRRELEILSAPQASLMEYYRVAPLAGEFSRKISKPN